MKQKKVVGRGMDKAYVGPSFYAENGVEFLIVFVQLL